MDCININEEIPILNIEENSIPNDDIDACIRDVNVLDCIDEESLGLNIQNCSIVNDDIDPCITIPIIYDNSDQNATTTATHRNTREHTADTAGEEKLDFHSHMVDHLRSFALEVENLPVSQNSKNCVFNLAKDLLRESYNFNCASIQHFIDSPDVHISEVLKVAQCEILNEIQKYSTVYKRNILCEENALYVKPEEKSIGTHWEIKKI